jgi:N-acetyl-anhydromuramyl-L-alanine amidase AmpD
VNFIQWLHRLFAALRNGRAQTSPKSSSLSNTSSTNEPSAAKKSVRKHREKQLNTPNVSKGRTIVPKAIVLHHTSGNYNGSVSWCMDPASKVSYHCIVAKDGRRSVLADPDERTWHAGVSSWRGRKDLNSWSVGAAFEGDTNKRELNEVEMASMADYLLPIMKRYGLQLRDVTDHRTVSPGRKDDLSMIEFARFKDYLAKRLA